LDFNKLFNFHRCLNDFPENVLVSIIFSWEKIVVTLVHRFEIVSNPKYYCVLDKIYLLSNPF
jgi:hypothetical protein